MRKRLRLVCLDRFAFSSVPLPTAWRPARSEKRSSVAIAAGETLVTRRYAIPAADPTTLVARMLADVGRALAQNPRLPVGVVQSLRDLGPEVPASLQQP